jgi:hypothetical protein
VAVVIRLLATAAAVLAVAGGAVAARGGPRRVSAQECEFSRDVRTVTFDRSRYPDIYQHWLDAIAKGWPKIMVLDRAGADARRNRLLRSIPTRAGQNRDELPNTILRSGWLADVEYVPASENKSQGASLGAQLRGVCDGVRVQYAWTP